MNKQTIKKEAVLSGVGAHTGQIVDLRLLPSRTGKIVFRRSDCDNLELSLSEGKINAVSSTVLSSQGKQISTIEHLMATLYALHIDSLTAELNGDEIPSLDGSAQSLLEAILKSGIKTLPGKQKYWKILRPFGIREKDAFVAVEPSDEFRITYKIEYDHPAIKKQQLSLAINPDTFQEQIAPARTFGFTKDAEKLRAKGLALGASAENTIILDESEIQNPPLRFPNEFVRHKILDFIGDIALLGSPVLGHFIAKKAGHHLHLKTVKFLQDNPSHFGPVTD